MHDRPDPHPEERTLRASVDGELGWRPPARCAAHLRRCPGCRAAVEEQRQLDRRASGLLAHLSVPADREAAWQRVDQARPTRRPAAPLLAVGATALGALGLGLLVGTWNHSLSSVAADRSSAGGRTKDVCCWNLDGGPRGDDGVVTVSTAGEAVACVILYDDVDGSHSFSAGDVVRFATASELCPSVGGIPASSAGAADARGLDGLPLAVR